jgi:hypothetical protein
MDKIIVRKKEIKGNSKDIFEDDVLSEHQVLLDFYDESEKDITYLKNAYEEIIENYINNEYFEVVYQIDELYLLKITEEGHLYLYKNDSRYVSKLTSWVYIIGKMYIGNVWWASDEEVCQDLRTISLVEFLYKYKGL